ncbi:uncharacterized protein [Engystomops pustulosus]|uniref:uncharacterized protein n=1 Tax=Engystomops pustulosus TaxID=76066 RepID=UPI003AFAB617
MNAFRTTTLSVLCAVLASVFSHYSNPKTCLSGLSTTSPTCLEESETDCTGDQCMIVSQYIYIYGKEYRAILKDCADEALCGAFGSATQSDVLFRGFVNCCKEKNCNTGHFYIPEDDRTPNGVICPDCFMDGTLEECVSNKTRACTGSEKKCFDYRGRVQLPVFSDCYSCLSKTSTTCDKVIVIPCPQKGCMIISQYVYINGAEYYSILKGCAISQFCGALGSATQDKVKVRGYVKCCPGESCNNGSFYIPEDDPTPNGLVCPNCFINGTLKECVSTKKINCTGIEDRCFEYRGTDKLPDDSVGNYSFKGCMNSFACKYNFNASIAVEEIQGDAMNCDT